MAKLRLRTDGIGYLVDGTPVDGFEDPAELDDESRCRVARWAIQYTPDSATGAQKELAGRGTTRRSSRRQRQLAENLERIRDLSSQGLWDALTEAERAWVVRPGVHPDIAESKHYPLTVGDVHALTGATKRQLRSWIDAGLVPATRQQTTRQVDSAGLAAALLLARQDQPEKNVLSRVREGRSSVFLHLMSSALRVWCKGLPAPQREEVHSVCEGLNRVGRMMADRPADGPGLAIGETAPSISISLAGEPPTGLGRILFDALDENTDLTLRLAQGYADRADHVLPALGMLGFGTDHYLSLNKVEIDPQALDTLMAGHTDGLSVIGHVVRTPPEAAGSFKGDLIARMPAGNKLIVEMKSDSPGTTTEVGLARAGELFVDLRHPNYTSVLSSPLDSTKPEERE